MGRVPGLARAQRPVTPDAELDPRRIDELVDELGDPDFVVEMVAVFNTTIDAGTGPLADALTAGDVHAVRLGAHGLCGCASNIGAAGLADVFAAIEQHALRGELAPALPLLATATQRLARVRLELDQLVRWLKA